MCPLHKLWQHSTKAPLAVSSSYNVHTASTYSSRSLRAAVAVHTARVHQTTIWSAAIAVVYPEQATAKATTKASIESPNIVQSQTALKLESVRCCCYH
eukprot:11681-Heterococcus_DN1.PRE.7